MKIQWLGHSSFRILGSKTIITDPFGSIGLSFPDVRADIVTVSHGHFDHNAVQEVKDEPAIVDDAGPHKVSGVTVTGYGTWHDDQQGAQRGRNLVFVIQMDGMKLAHLGDLGCMPDHDVLTALANVDVLFIPVGGHYTIDAKTAQELIAQVKPRTVIPMHYKTKGMTVDVAPIDAFLQLNKGVTPIAGYEAEITPMAPAMIVFERPMGQQE